MKLNFRDIKKKQFTVEAEPSASVGDVKKQVAEHESAETSQIRLIHSGKVLADDKTVESYGIKESDHIICMVSKPKPPPVSNPAPSTPAQSSTSSQTPAAPAQAATAPSSQNAPGTPTPAGTTQSAAERRFDDTSPLMGPERQSAIASMESMGFQRPEIERAMRAAFYNPDRAVDFLLNGIPESAQRELDQATQRPSSTGQQQQAQQATSQQPSGADITAAGTTQPNPPATGDEPVNLFEAAAAQNQGGRGSGNTSSGTTTTGDGSGLGGQAAAQGGNLEFLRNNPMFVQLRNLVQSQPQMLEQVLHQVSAANPQLAQLISQNPQQFLEMLTEGGEGEGGERMVPPGVREVSVTEEERDAIERLCRLGFERDLVIQAYFACDKNEELAANFLFDNQGDEDDGGAGGAA